MCWWWLITVTFRDTEWVLHDVWTDSSCGGWNVWLLASTVGTLRLQKRNHRVLYLSLISGSRFTIIPRCLIASITFVKLCLSIMIIPDMCHRLTIEVYDLGWSLFLCFYTPSLVHNWMLKLAQCELLKVKGGVWRHSWFDSFAKARSPLRVVKFLASTAVSELKCVCTAACCWVERDGRVGTTKSLFLGFRLDSEVLYCFH